MILDLTDEQKAFQQQVAAFARERVAPQAAAHRRDAARSRATLMRAAAALGLMGVTIPHDVGRRRPRLRQLRAGDRGARAGERGRRRHRRRQQLARRRADRALRHATRRSETWLRRLATGRGARRLRAVGGARRHPTPRTSRRSRASTSAATCINGRKVWVANAEAADLVIVFAATQPGLRGRGISAFLVPMDTPGITRVATRRFARRARPRLHGSRARRRPRRRRRAARARRARDSASRCGRSTAAASRSPRRRSASATAALEEALDLRARRARRSASRSATTRRSSGCSPTWPPSSTRRGC